MGITKVYILGHQLPSNLSKACGMNVLFLSSLLGWQNPKPLANNNLFPGRDMETVLLCWQNSHETKDVIHGRDARSQQTNSSFSLLLAVSVGEKKSDFANTGIRNTPGETSCYPKRWAWRHITFSNLSFHILFYCFTTISYFTTLPWIRQCLHMNYSFQSGKVQQASPEKALPL